MCSRAPVSTNNVSYRAHKVLLANYSTDLDVTAQDEKTSLMGRKKYDKGLKHIIDEYFKMCFSKSVGRKEHYSP